MSGLLGPTGIYWGDLACLAAGFSGVSTIGWEPSVFTVRCLTSQVLRWGVRHDPTRFLPLKARAAPAIAAALTAAAPARFAPITTLPYRAPLLVRQIRDGKTTELPIADLYLCEARPVDGATNPPEMVLVLADVRRFWRDYGVLSCDFNVPVGFDKEGKPTIAPRSAEPSEVRPWTTSVAVQRCLNELPGKPRLAYWPPEHDPPVRAARCVGASPLEVAQQFVADARLTFSLNLDGTASLWLPGSVTTWGETPGGKGTHNSVTHDLARNEGAWKDSVSRELLGQRTVVDAPDEIVVVGPPPVQTIKVDYLEPVLPYDEPLPTGGTVRKIIPVTPDLLDRLLAVFGGAKFQGSELFLPTVQVGNTTQVRTPRGGLAQVAPQGTDQAARQRATLFRAPFLGDAWPSLDFLPRALRDLLRSRLWRFWRVPERYWRYLPVLDRAERVNGKRLPPLAEAFSWAQMTAVVRGGEDDGTEPDTRTVDEAELASVVSRLATVKDAIATRTVDLKDIQDAADQFLTNLPAIKQVAGTLQSVGLPPASVAGAAFASNPKMVQVTHVLVEKAPSVLAELLSLRNPGDFDSLGKEVDQLKREEAELVARRNALLEKVDPVKAAEVAYAEAAKRRTEAYAASSLPLIAKVEVELAEASRRLQAARVARKPTAKRTRKVLRLVPKPRGPLEARVSKDGLVEFSDVVGWPNDFGRADIRETYLIPLPVSLTFGTWGLPDNRATPFPPIPPEKVTDNPIVQAGVDILSNQGLTPYLAGAGHLLPRIDGAPLRLAFTRGNLSGKAQVGPHPYRITARPDDARLQILRTLKASVPEVEVQSNEEAVTAEAAARAAAAFAQLQVREAGSLSVLGPRPVNLDGRVTAVRWESDASGQVTTHVHVDSDAEPLPGFDQDTPRADEGPSTFGLDLGVDATAYPAPDDPRREATQAPGLPGPGPASS